MSQSVGPILAAGALTVTNQSILGDEPFNWRVPVATLTAAGVLALIEQGWPAGARAIAWMALLTVILARTAPGIPSPAERLVTAWSSGSTGTGTGPVRSI